MTPADIEAAKERTRAVIREAEAMLALLESVPNLTPDLATAMMERMVEDARRNRNIAITY